eukprot:14358206-Alexandrium_andersonii.AAC.1
MRSERGRASRIPSLLTHPRQQRRRRSPEQLAPRHSRFGGPALCPTSNHPDPPGKPGAASPGGGARPMATRHRRAAQHPLDRGPVPEGRADQRPEGTGR